MLDSAAPRRRRLTRPNPPTAKKPEATRVMVAGSGVGDASAVNSNGPLSVPPEPVIRPTSPVNDITSLANKRLYSSREIFPLLRIKKSVVPRPKSRGSIPKDKSAGAEVTVTSPNTDEPVKSGGRASPGDDPRHGCAHLIRDGHARQVPSRPPDHQLPIRYGHGVRCREAIIRPERLLEASYGAFAGPSLAQGLAFASKTFQNRRTNDSAASPSRHPAHCTWAIPA
jgi:hypothetical protein